MVSRDMLVYLKGICGVQRYACVFKWHVVCRDILAYLNGMSGVQRYACLPILIACVVCA